MSIEMTRSRFATQTALGCLLSFGPLIAQAADDLTKPLRVSPDGHFLMQPDGAPFFWLADTGWSLFQHLDREGAEQYLANRASKGYNIIQAAIFGPAHTLVVSNRHGELPLVDLDPARPNPQ